MSAGDVMGGGFNPDAARYDRMNRTQPAEFAPGQGAVFQQQDAFAQSSMPNDPGAMGDIFNTQVGGGVSADAMNPFGPSSAMGGMPGMSGAGGMMASPNSMVGGMQQPQQQQDASDKFWASVGKGFNSATTFFKQVTEASRKLNVRWYSEWGFLNAKIGAGIIVIGIVSSMFGFAPGLEIAAGGALVATSGLVMWLWLTEAARSCSSKYKDEPASPVQQQQPAPPASDFGFGGQGSDFGFGDSGGSDFFGDGSDSFGDDSFGQSSEGDDWGDDPYGDDDPYAGLEEEDDKPEQGMSTVDALNSLPEVPAGMYERNYLWEMFVKVLPTMHPGFAKMRTIDESDDVFLRWDDMLREAAGVAGCKEDFLPDLLELQENMFVVVVTCNRPQGFKPEATANELASIYAYKDGTKNDNVFAKVDTVGAKCIITIFNGAAAMISLKDMMLQEKAWICDTKNYMPVVIGIDQLGHVITIDCKKLESIIITGMPRSGKSWFVQAMLTQMCAFTPPSELHVYICDPKDEVSDFKDFRFLPHVKKFVAGDDNIVKTLKHLVKDEAPRRKKIIGDAGFVNIWDFKERNPSVKLPVIYVVIDEVVTIASRMEKETYNEFRMLLRELISQLPALGIRAFLIPHVLNNDIIEKKTSDLVPCKISVCGDADHIERATGSKPRDFPYKLVNKGDMAVKLTGFNSTLYVHGPALTDSNPGNAVIFDYLRQVWAKLEPGEKSGSELHQTSPSQSAPTPQPAPIQVGDLSGGAVDEPNPVSDEPEGLGYADIVGDDDDIDDFQLF